MGDSSPTTIIFSGILIASFALKLKQDYIYLAYAAVIIGLGFFIMGIVKYIKQRNYYK